jgi:hypothetical protein
MAVGSKIGILHWCLDCVAPSGDLFIGEAVSIRWSTLHINLVSGIFSRNDRVECKNSVVFREVFPKQSGNELTWDCAPLSIRGTWKAIAPPIEKPLFSGGTGNVSWQIAAPRAEVSVEVNKEYTLSGIGFADHCEIAINEWALPVRELRWGRYLSDKESFQWIDLTGAESHVWVWRNGIEQAIASVTDDVVAIDDSVTLGLGYRKAIREGHLGDTLLGSLPVLAHLVPKKIGDVYECTWRTRGVLLQGVEQIDTGWAIHRLIRFPK